MSRLIFAFLALFVLQAKTWAENEKPLVVFAVGDQEIMLRRGISLEINCEANPLARVAIILPPKNGKITERRIEDFPNYEKENARFPCNERRVPAVAAYYKPNSGFKGVDHFEFAIVYFDGTASRFKGSITVW